MKEIAEAITRLAVAQEEWNRIQQIRLDYDRKFWTTPEEYDKEKAAARIEHESTTIALQAAAAKLTEEAMHLKAMREAKP
jgi:hypothetical protein